MSFFLDESLFTLALRIADFIFAQWRRDWAKRSEDTPLADLVLVHDDDPRTNRKREATIGLVADNLEERLRDSFGRDFATLADDAPTIVSGLAETFAEAKVTLQTIISVDVDPRTLADALQALRPDVRESLTESGGLLYDLVLRECCNYVVEVALELPAFESAFAQELLVRTTALYELVVEILERMPSRDPAFATALPDVVFAEDYRRAVVRKLDDLVLFGLDSTPERLRRYPLSVAYISLSVSSPGLNATPPALAGRSGSSHVRIEAALADRKRCLIRGEAGSGKTTLLRWLAVRAASGDFSGPMSSWNHASPFLLPLRGFAEADLPSPDQFVSALMPSMQAPHKWIENQLRLGAALVLVDGIDELPQHRRHEAREWLSELVGLFPQARFIVTTRPPAASIGWLATDDFDEFVLQPMTRDDTRTFIAHWHDAAKTHTSVGARVDELDALEIRLQEEIKSTPHLSALATTPLICAMLCSLARDRPGGLPRYRTELYRLALEMLLDRRERDRKVPRELLPLERPEIESLLQELAYWLVINDQAQMTREEANRQVAIRLRSLPHVAIEREQAVAGLLLRTGLLREPSIGAIDFVHKTFQEYFAAAEIRDKHHFPLLLKHAGADSWYEVLILAAGLATSSQRETLVRGLLDLAEETGEPRLKVAAVESLGASPEMSPALAEESRAAIRSLIPPANDDEARALAVGREDVVDLVRRYATAPPDVAAASVRCLGYIGSPQAMEALADFTTVSGPAVAEALLDVWGRFDAERYAEIVLAELRLEDETLLLRDEALIGPSTRLKHCQRLDCQFAGTLPNAVTLAAAPNLWRLCAADAGEFANFARLGAQTRLEHVAIERAPVLTGLGPTTSLPNLVTARLGFTPKLSSIAELACLECLELGEAPALDLAAALRRVPNLSVLAYSRGKPPEDAGVEYIDRSRGRVSREGRESEPTDEDAASESGGLRDLATLASCTRLTTVTLEWITELVDIQALERLGSLKRLSLRHCSRLEDVAPAARCSALTKLDLSDCPRVVAPPSWALGSLRVLSLAGCSSVRSVGGLIEVASTLEWLSLSGIQADDLDVLADLVSLQRLDLAAAALDDVAFARTLPQLSDLSLAFCARVRTVKPLAEHSSLARLDVRGCLLLDGLSPLQACPLLNTLVVTLEHQAIIDEIATIQSLERLEVEGDAASFDLQQLTDRQISVVMIPKRTPSTIVDF